MPKLNVVPPRLWIGIDPGASGGIACSSVPGVAIGTVAYPMPSTERDVFEMLALTETANRMCLIEGVHSFPKQGVASSFKFGRNYGFLRGCLIALGIPFEEVSPQRWQKLLGIPSRGKQETKAAFKQRLKAKAQQLFPEVSVTLKTADALLIMEYCRRAFP